VLKVLLNPNQSILLRTYDMKNAGTLQLMPRNPATVKKQQNLVRNKIKACIFEISNKQTTMILRDTKKSTTQQC